MHLDVLCSNSGNNVLQVWRTEIDLLTPGAALDLNGQNRKQVGLNGAANVDALVVAFAALQLLILPVAPQVFGCSVCVEDQLLAGQQITSFCCPS